MISKDDVIMIPTKSNRLGIVQEMHNNVTCTTKFVIDCGNITSTENVMFENIEVNIDKAISIDKIYENVSKKT